MKESRSDGQPALQALTGAADLFPWPLLMRWYRALKLACLLSDPPKDSGKVAAELVNEGKLAFEKMLYISAACHSAEVTLCDAVSRLRAATLKFSTNTVFEILEKISAGACGIPETPAHALEAMQAIEAVVAADHREDRLVAAAYRAAYAVHAGSKCSCPGLVELIVGSLGQNRKMSLEVHIAALTALSRFVSTTSGSVHAAGCGLFKVVSRIMRIRDNNADVQTFGNVTFYQAVIAAGVPSETAALDMSRATVRSLQLNSESDAVASWACMSIHALCQTGSMARRTAVSEGAYLAVLGLLSPLRHDILQRALVTLSVLAVDSQRAALDAGVLKLVPAAVQHFLRFGVDACNACEVPARTARAADGLLEAGGLALATLNAFEAANNDTPLPGPLRLLAHAVRAGCLPGLADEVAEAAVRQMLAFRGNAVIQTAGCRILVATRGAASEACVMALTVAGRLHADNKQIKLLLRDFFL
jgi:hypothetical protein